ncbi:hypothetical protein J31TS4_29360 [Paenibacillus sp. J31TS4]|uniref:hypothetical protein n=1 Tax=Paenibacillus sp. J31TS4 TaxID=2807195 RepID=UPI001B10A6C3|nr:hypothetical protein [Paenibacillus sp. J31TS4]GIP39656.1 hypothetical protein J31TS4_29360 [Paenibacillus sp. J31TS4]
MRATKSLFLAAAAGLLLLSGCNKPDGEELKKQALDALNKQQEMKTYTFKGEADLAIGQPPAPGADNPIASTLTGMFTSGKLAWEGTASTDPLRVEADLKATPAGGSTALSLPLQLQDKKLFLSIPFLSKPGESYSLDLDQLASLTGRSAEDTEQQLKLAGSAGGKLTATLLDGFDADWFRPGPEADKESAMRTIRVEVTDKNAQKATDALHAKWPELIEQLRTSGLLTDKQAEAAKTGGSSVQVKAPGLLELHVDEQGFVRKERIELKFAVTKPDGTNAERTVTYDQAFDAINAEPSFKKEPPKQVFPLETVLRQLMRTK